MMRRRRGQATDPRDLGASARGGRLSRFRRGRQDAPPPPESAGRGGCCLWPFVLTLAAAVAGVVLIA